MGSSQRQRAEFLPLRGLATILMLLLGIIISAILARLAVQMFGLASAHWQHVLIIRLDKVADYTVFGLIIPFLMWFYRSRINAEGHGYRQRRARGWAFWGWIIPIVSLWIPFQVMGDVWRAGRPDDQRRKTAWLPAFWWLGWLLSGLSFGVRTHPSRLDPQVTASTPDGLLLVVAITGLLLIAIVRTVSYGPVGTRPLAPEVAASFHVG